MLSDYRNHERIQPLQGVTAHVADVQAERELIHIAMQVLLGNLMVNAIHSALEHSPNAFNAVRADSVLGVDASRVIDSLVAKEQPVEADVSGRFVRKDRGTYFDVGVDSRLKRSQSVASIGIAMYVRLAPGGPGRQFCRPTASSLEFFVIVFVGSFPPM